ncbi:MAG: sulfotransferase [Alteromonadaceae bacterium TMED7]|nr:sulfotransferase domain-containing protein [Alteromonas sp.]RPH22292.1 MAG: sulfotransferase [Alteromonadaceae bacterium TMED7]|tara:strand:- start:17051 stop:17899 length:849 start_codon:yes stop_codon:yes gene_type:complete
MSREQFKVDFIGVGSGKCGSTWLYENVIQHPEVFDGNPKEIHYFGDLYEQQDFNWYKDLFAGSEGKIKGEFSISYMYHPKAAERIHKHFPDAKIIAMVRDPVERTYSDYQHFIRKGDVSRDYPFSEYIRDQDKLKFGYYTDYLAPFYEHFPKENILVLVLEEMQHDLAACYKQIFEFIGVNNTNFLPEGVEEKRNQGVNYRFLKLENVLVRTYRFMVKRGLTGFAERLKRSGLAQLVRKMNAKSEPLPEMDSASRQQLVDYFAEEQTRLAQLLGRDTQIWNR